MSQLWTTPFLTTLPEEDMALKILHTADWHLGLRFPALDEDDQPKLTRARLDVIDRILAEADGYSVNAVLCAGDLFDEPAPDEIWWKGLLDVLRKRASPSRPIVLLPGNHDPLTDESVYRKGHPFRQQLPPGVHVVDRPDFTLELGSEAILYAVPCTSRAGELDPTTHLPPRAAGDGRIRIGMAHGQTFDIAGYETNFPIAADAAARLGLDYLALGDTHSLRTVLGASVPTVYPGTPEQTKFDELDTGHVVLVFFRRPGSPPRIMPVKVGRWMWRDLPCRDLNALRQLRNEPDLATTVLRLRLEMTVTLTELGEVNALSAELKGTLAAHGKVGVMQIDRHRLEQRLAGPEEFPEDLPEVLRNTVERLRSYQDAQVAGRALYHLYQLLRQSS